MIPKKFCIVTCILTFISSVLIVHLSEMLAHWTYERYPPITFTSSIAIYIAASISLLIVSVFLYSNIQLSNKIYTPVSIAFLSLITLTTGWNFLVFASSLT